MRTPHTHNARTASDRGQAWLLTVSEVAAALGLSNKTVNKLVREKKLACVQATARERRFTHEQVEDYIRSRTTSVRVDKKDPHRVSSPPRKGGAKSFGHSGVDLREEMKKWR